MKRFSGTRVLIGCALFIFIVSSGSGLHSAGYSMLSETFHVSMSTLGTYTMVLTVSGIISAVLLTSVKQKITLKGVLYYNIAVFYFTALSTRLFGNSVLTMLIFFFSIGTTLSMGAHAVMTEIVSNWYVTRRAQKISLMLGSALLGQAAYQFLGGQIFSRMDLLSGWFFLYTMNGTLLLLIVRFLIVATDPAELGQTALGGENLVPERMDQSIEKSPGKARRSLYRSPLFWLCLVGDWGLAGGVNYITMYGTSLFTQNGLSLGMAATILSCATISAAVFSFLNGHFLKWLHVRDYLIFLLGGVIGGNLVMILFERMPSLLLMIPLLLFYGIGYSGAHCINLLANIIFDPEDAANANSKISGIAMSGGLLLLPLNGYLVEHIGYSAAYLMVIAMAGLSLISYLIALFLAKTQGKSLDV